MNYKNYLALNKLLVYQGLYSQGKSKEKGPFHLGEGESGKVRKTCNALGKIAVSYCMSGRFYF